MTHGPCARREERFLWGSLCISRLALGAAGFHNKMEMMSRRAYGFRNFENYRMRVMTHCGWDGIINRV